MNNQPEKLDDINAFRDNDFLFDLRLEDGIVTTFPVTAFIGVDSVIREDIIIPVVATSNSINFTITKEQWALLFGLKKIRLYIAYAGVVKFGAPVNVTLDPAVSEPRTKLIRLPTVGVVRVSLSDDVAAVAKSEEAATRAEIAADKAALYGNGTKAVNPTDSPEVGINVVRPLIAGTYANFSNITVSAGDLADNLVELLRSGSTWTKSLTGVNTTLGPKVDRIASDVRGVEIYTSTSGARSGSNSAGGTANGAASTISFPNGQAPGTTSLTESVPLSSYPDLIPGTKIRFVFILTEIPSGVFDITSRYIPLVQLNVTRNGSVVGNQGTRIAGFERLSANQIRCYVDYTIQMGDTVLTPYFRLDSDVNNTGVTIVIKWEPTQFTFVKEGTTYNNTSEYVNRINKRIQNASALDRGVSISDTKGVAINGAAAAGNAGTISSVYYNEPNSIVQYPSDVSTLKFWADSIGTLYLAIGIPVFGEPFEPRKILGPFNVVIGENDLSINETLFAGECIALGGGNGTTKARYTGAGSVSTNRYVEQSITTNIGSRGAFGSFFAYSFQVNQYPNSSQLVEAVRKVPQLETELSQLKNQLVDDDYERYLERNRIVLWVADGASICDVIDGITDSSYTKRYMVKFSGYHQETRECKIYHHPFVSLMGVGPDAHIHYENPDNGSLSSIQQNSTLFFGRDNGMYNFKATGRNCRYVIHFDNGRIYKYGHNYMDDLWVEHLGNQGVIDYLGTSEGVWPFWDALGSGSSDGEILEANRCTFISKNSPGAGIHNNANFEAPARYTFTDCTFYNKNANGAALKIDAYGSGTPDIVEFIRCDIQQAVHYYSQNWFTSNPLFQPSDVREMTLSFRRMIAPSIVDFTVGRALKIELTAAGDNSIRLSGSALTALGGFVYKDGAAGMAAYCYSQNDVAGLRPENTLGRRLGNCTSVNKVLTLTRKTGAVVNITFNLNYTSMNNGDIVDLINTALGSVGSASIYRPARWENRQDQGENQVYVRNSTGVAIRPGKGVMYTNKTNSKIVLSDPALNLDFAGVTAEWIRPGDLGRVFKVARFVQQVGNVDLTISGTLAEGVTISLHPTNAGDFQVGTTRPVGFCDNYGDTVLIQAD